jgi:hypothetical protein
MSVEELAIAVRESNSFKEFEEFRKDLCRKRSYSKKLLDLFIQAKREGIEYIKNNPNVSRYDVQLINEILK